MSQALYRKYRSRSLDQVLGQDHVTSILRRALEKGKIAHAYLLTGPRGVGKTSVARILAHEINDLPYDEDATHLDIIEIDAASNNGVDDIRALREKAQIAPVSAAKKIYIIDEVHMLSKPAFNALLKTLEEPPAHIVFILATTDADKLPATILSRVQQFYFRPISVEVMTRQLMNIAEQEGFRIDEAAARMIAERSKGGFRDGISLLDQLSALAAANEPLTTDVVANYLGLSDQRTLEQLLDMYQAGDGAQSFTVLQRLTDEGADPTVVSRQLLSLLRARLHQQPELIHLVRQLIEIDKHPHPDLKLLTIFMQQVPAGDSSDSEYSLRAAKAGPWRSADGGKPPVTAPSSNESPAESSKTKKSKEHSEKNDSPTDEQVKKKNRPKIKSPTKLSGDFNWQTLLTEAKAASAGLASLLQKCSYRLDGDRLTIYTGNKFTQKKLDDTKFRSILTEIIAKMIGDIDITFKGETKPPEDENLAKIAELMGGGEEVKLEEVK